MNSSNPMSKKMSVMYRGWRAVMPNVENMSPTLLVVYESRVTVFDARWCTEMLTLY